MVITIDDAKANLGQYAYLLSPRGVNRYECKIIGISGSKILVKFVLNDLVCVICPSRLILKTDSDIPVEHKAKTLVRRLIDIMHDHHWYHTN